MVLGPRVVEVGQVAAVVDDALRVGVREPDPRDRRVLERRLPVGDLAELDRRHDRISVEHLVALPLHLLLRARLEVEAQQRLGVRGAHVEVPVVVVDRDPVEVA